MGWYPHARRRPMPYNDSLPKREHSPTVILHTNGGGTDNGSLYRWFARVGNKVCSHFQVFTDGTIEQYVDTDRQAYAQHSGNPFAVSIETQDDGHPSRPWTTEQVDAILAICRWLKVPARPSPDGPGGGIGWHQQYDAWNTSKHDCPGPVRVSQIKNTLIPELAGEHMPLSDDDVQKILDAPIGHIDNDPHKVNHTVRSLLKAVGHEVYAIRSITTQDLAVDKKQ